MPITKLFPSNWVQTLAILTITACHTVAAFAAASARSSAADGAEVLATPLQTRWLIGLCVVAVFVPVLGWMLHRWHLRRVVSRIRAQLEQRLDERERVAREVHDSLLGSVQDLVVVLNSTARRVTVQSERATIENALLAADDVIHDGRERMRGLRHAGEIGNLFNALELHGKMLAQHVPTDFSAQIIGEPRHLRAAVGETFHALGKEALSGAFRHAGITRVELLLQYGAAELRMTIRDNGKASSAENQPAGGRNGMWNLAGAQERAQAIGAQLQGQNNASSGTLWLLTLPARQAYQSDEGDSPIDRLADRLARLFGRK